MEPFGVEVVGNQFVIRGLPPDTVKIVALQGPKAKRMADLTLHEEDLTFAATALERLDASSDPFIRQVLWRSAIVFYVKCFTGDSARSQLDARRVYGGDQGALTAYQYTKNLRDKHFIHDESSYTQCLTGLAINDGTKPYKVEKVICISVIGETLNPSDLRNLRQLVGIARTWVVREVEEYMKRFTEELEKEPHASLDALPQITFTAPAATDVATRRKSGQ